MSISKFSPAKREIFEVAVELFSERGFETVSISDIGDAIGKRKSAIYNHYESKQEILDNIYDFFCEHCNDMQLSIPQLDGVIRTGSLLDIISAVNFHYSEKYNDILVKIMRIVQQRKFHDERARLIARDVTLEQYIKYAQEVFDYAVEIGRFEPFDTQALAGMCTYYRHCTYMRWVLDPTPETNRCLVEFEERAYNHAAKLVHDLKK